MKKDDLGPGCIKDATWNATSERNFGSEQLRTRVFLTHIVAKAGGPQPLASLSPICITTFSVVSGCIGGHNWMASAKHLVGHLRKFVGWYGPPGVSNFVSLVLIEWSY